MASDSKLIDRIYDALQSVETGPNTPTDSRFVRTKVRPKEGSSAYGPVQVNKDRLADIYKNTKFTPEENQFFKNTLTPQAANFIKFGRRDENDPILPGYDPKWDYGGAGEYKKGDANFQNLYTSAMKKAISRELSDVHKGDVNKFARGWHASKDESVNDEYVKKFRTYFDKNQV